MMRLPAAREWATGRPICESAPEPRGVITREFALDYIFQLASDIDGKLRRLGYEPGAKGNYGSQEHARL